MSDATAVVVDTDVFSASLVPRRSALAPLYAAHLIGRSLIISPQTVAELRYGALRARWGQARMSQVEARIRAAAVAPYDDKLAWTYARLKNELVARGHGLGQKQHDGDRWIAATALRYGIPLVAHDGIFKDVPGLSLVTENR